MLVQALPKNILLKCNISFLHFPVLVVKPLHFRIWHIFMEMAYKPSNMLIDGQEDFLALIIYTKILYRTHSTTLFAMNIFKK